MDDIPYGFCHCGCGEQTNIVRCNITRTGQKKGEPYKYIRGHQTRITADVIEKDCGYETPCWVLDLDRESIEYTRLQRDGKREMLHRVYYEWKFGPIPEGLMPHHKCENPPCFNPDHIELVTNARNVQLGRRAKLTMENAREIRRVGTLVRARVFAEKFGVSEDAVESIRRGETWKE